MSESMNILQRLNEVRKSVEYVKKDALVNNQYKAVSHDMVTAKVREHLISNGIMVLPSLKSSTVANTGSQTSKGVPIIRYEAVYEVSFINIDDPQDKISVDVEAHANDHGDKAPGKALSYATKYALLKVFSIETGEDDESRIEAIPTAHTDEQKQVFDAALAEGDSFGLVAFLSVCSEDVQTSLFNSFEAGAKSSGKERVREMNKEGTQKWEETIADVEGLIDVQDSHGLKETVSELEKHEKVYLARKLGDRKAQDLGSLISQAA